MAQTQTETEPRPRNSFADAVPWQYSFAVRGTSPRPAVPDTPPAGEPRPVSDSVGLTYRGAAAYAFDEAVVWVSMKPLARDRGLSVRTKPTPWRDQHGNVVRAKNGEPLRSKFEHNVYELLAPFATSEPTVRRIVRRAHKRPVIAARARAAKTRSEGEYPDAS